METAWGYAVKLSVRMDAEPVWPGGDHRAGKGKTEQAKKGRTGMTPVRLIREGLAPTFFHVGAPLLYRLFP